MERKSAYLRFCCFLTGLSYPLTRISSEQSVKNAKKYFGALLIIMLVWFFIGYCFATRYLHIGVAGGVIGGLLMSFIILQIERIIILSHHISGWGKAFRILLGIVMALIGAMIMDQFTFKDDIDLRKVQVLDIRVKEAVKIRESDIQEQIIEVDSMIRDAELRYENVSDEVAKKPIVTAYQVTETFALDSTGKQVPNGKIVTGTPQPNPKTDELKKLEAQITDLNNRKFGLLKDISELHEKVRIELKNSMGFLDELTMLKEVIASSWVSMLVYCLILFFFLSLELFILIMKLSDKESDYDKLVDHQMDVRIQMLERLKAHVGIVK